MHGNPPSTRAREEDYAAPPKTELPAAFEGNLDGHCPHHPQSLPHAARITAVGMPGHSQHKLGQVLFHTRQLTLAFAFAFPFPFAFACALPCESRAALTSPSLLARLLTYATEAILLVLPFPPLATPTVTCRSVH